MKKTEGFHLNQWELTDRVVMEDFNRDNLLIDTALSALSGDLTGQAADWNAALDAARKELGLAIQSGDAALSSRISSLDSKQTQALNTAKNQLNASLQSAKTALEAADAALDAKRQGLLDAARTALEAEDQRLDGCKLQWYHIGHGEINAMNVTGVQQLPLGDPRMGDYYIVLFDFQLTAPAVSILGHESGTQHRIMSNSGCPSYSGLLAPAAKETQMVGFPLKRPQGLVRTLSLGANFFAAYSSCTWGNFKTLSLFNQQPASSTPASYLGSVDVYGIK